MLQPLKTELKVDACVLSLNSPIDRDIYISGRIHEVKDNGYVIEWLQKVRDNLKKMRFSETHQMSELVVVYSAWCSKCYLRFLISSVT